MRLKGLVTRGVALTFIGAVIAVYFASGADSKAKINPVVSAYCSVLGEPQVSYAPCTASGESIFTVDDPVSGDQVGYDTSIAIGADGFPVISYKDFSAGAVIVAKCSDRECRLKRTITIVDSQASGLAGTSIAIGADGFPVISYRDGGAASLKVAKCSDAACKTSTNAVVDDPANDLGLYSSLAIGTDGMPVISYYDQSAGALKVAKCSTPGCTGALTRTIVDNPANDVGSYSSLAIGTDGNPVVSYFDLSAGKLKVAKCDDPACAPGGEIITTINDPGASVGWYSSIAVGSDGIPVISYYDASPNFDLKVAKCNDPACAGANETISTVDGAPVDVGQGSSLALGANGDPVISYRDAAAAALKVALCNDPACANGDETLTVVDDPVNVIGTISAVAIGIDRDPVIAYQDFTAKALKVARVSH